MGISDKTRKLLWGRSGNRCAVCRCALIADATDADPAAVVGDECHIIAQGAKGPRARPVPLAELDDYANLILLCRTHHKQIDDQPNEFSEQKVRDLKTAHERWVATTLGEYSKENGSSSAAAVAELPPGGWEREDALPSHVPSEQLFSWRLSDAFPGRRGLIVIDDPKEAIDRLDILLRAPLVQRHQNPDGSVGESHPLWWFRGPINMFIDGYRRIADEKCIIGWDELKVTKVAAYRTTASPLWEFVYVEAAAELPTGIYTYEPGYVEKQRDECEVGYFFSEEYAIWNGRPIRREEYDDGAALIDGKPVRISNAEVRVRFLTPYNFIVCGGRHVSNDVAVDWEIARVLDAILRGEQYVDDLVTFVKALPKPARYLGEDW